MSLFQIERKAQRNNIQNTTKVIQHRHNSCHDWVPGEVSTYVMTKEEIYAVTNRSR